MLRRGQAIVSPKRRLAQRLSSPDRLGTLPGPEEKRRIERQDREATRPRPCDGRPDPQRGPARLPFQAGPPTGDRAPQRGTVPEDDPGMVARSRGKAGSAVESRSRGACALRPRSATSGSTSMCGREAGGTLHRPTPRQEAQRPGAGGPWLHSRSRGHRRTSGNRRGEVAGRGLGGRHGSPSPGRRAVASAPPSSRCWPCSAAGRPGKQAKRCASTWGRTRSSCTRRTTARSPRPTGRLPGRALFFFAQPYRS